MRHSNDCNLLSPTVTVSLFQRRPYRIVLLGIVAILGISSVLSDNAAAVPYRGRSSYSGRAAAAAKAQRAKMVKNLQNQVSSARQVLTNLESQAVMTQSQLTAASTQLEGIQQGIEDIQHDAADAAKSLHEIESEILLAQTSSSEYSKANTAVDAAKKAVHLAIHEVLNLSLEDDQPSIDPVRDHMKNISDSQRDSLQTDARYKEANTTLREAIRNVGQVRTKLFQDSKDWAAAHQDLIDANHKKHEEEKTRRQTGTAVTGKKHELQNMASIAANARSIIAQGEFQLRQMGAPVPASSSTQQKPR